MGIVRFKNCMICDVLHKNRCRWRCA